MCGTEPKVTRVIFTTQRECNGMYIWLTPKIIMLLTGYRVFSVKFTPDNKYILSGSDDGNIRLWRANASDRSGIKSARQRAKLEYDQALIQRYSHMPQIRRIKRQRHVPKPIKKAGEIKREELNAIKRRQENIRKHTRKDKLKPRESERQKMILTSEQ